VLKENRKFSQAEQENAKKILANLEELAQLLPGLDWHKLKFWGYYPSSYSWIRKVNLNPGHLKLEQIKTAATAVASLQTDPELFQEKKD
jgi:carbon monoxide dehydrogenase subunit G